MKSTSKWTKNFQSITDNGRGHEVTLDLPQAKGGDDTGATALELGVMGLSGCISTIYAVVASNMNVKFSELEIILEAHKTDADPTITGVDFELKIKTENSERDVEKVLTKTLKICPVGILFEQAGIKQNYTINLI